MNRLIAGIMVFSVLSGVHFASGYGGGSSSTRKSGGIMGSISENVCSDFRDISPEKNEKVRVLSEVSFLAPYGYDSDTIEVMINGENLSIRTKEKASGDILVTANLPSPLSQEATVKVSLHARDQNKCEKNSVYFIQIDPNTEELSNEEGEKEEQNEENQGDLHFSDTRSHWSRSYIEQMIDRGIVNGYGDGKFYPDNVINRSELVKIVLLALKKGSGEKGIAPFEDVPAENWAAPYILKAKQLGVVKGYWGNRFFEPFSEGTRVMVLKMLVETAEIDVSGYRGQQPFPDVDSKTWYAPYVAWAKEKGVVGGYANGNFGPNNAVTRGEVSKITMNFLKIMNL